MGRPGVEAASWTICQGLLAQLGGVNDIVVEPQILGGDTERKAHQLRKVQHGHAGH